MKLSQVKVKDLVVGALVIAAEAPSEERVYLDDLECWKLTLITERGRRFWELHLTNADNVSRKHILVLGVTVAEAAYVFGKPKEIHNDKEPLMLDFTQIKGVIKLDPSSMRLLELINFPLDVPEGATHIAFFKDGESAQYVAFENGVGMFPAFAMVTYYPCNRFDV